MMKKLIVILSMLPILMFGILHTQEKSDESPVLKHPYLDQRSPGMTPEVFASGVVSKKGSDEWGLAVNADWTEIFFSRAKNDRSSIIHIERSSDSWSEQKVASFSGKYSDSHPVFSPDGKKLFFGSKRPCLGARGVLNLWFVE